jgi:hypothetical protein
MPSMERLSGVELFLRFKFNSQIAEFNDVRLHSDDLNWNGFFHLDSNHLVSSRNSILFSRELLSESPIGQKVIELVPKAWELPFEFQLSGDLNRMNFQWEDSLLKRKVEDRIPHFIEQSIQQRMDEKVSSGAAVFNSRN